MSNSNSKCALLIIDAQKDFCYNTGSLYVPGAENDVKVIGDFIRRNKLNIDYIGLTMDSHQVVDISHPSFWQDKNGNPPSPFTLISVADIESGKWAPRYWANESIKYIKELDAQKEYQHCIWPEHCIMGTDGAAIVDEVMKPVIEWCREGNVFKIVAKGTHPLTEHFGAFRANIEIPGYPETHINMELINELSTYRQVFFAGEAKSHCVANTVKQAIQFPDLAKKMVILEDCMSNVPSFEHLADDIYNDAKAAGVQFMNAKDITL